MTMTADDTFNTLKYKRFGSLPGFGSKATYWVNDLNQLHRKDGPAVERADGTKEWWVNGELHREDGPAVEYYNGTKAWFRNDKLHREDGPAIERADGSKEWYLNGVRQK